MKYKNNMFDKDFYDTPANAGRSLGNRLLLGNRFYFYFHNFFVFFKTGMCARRGELDAENQIYYSNQNFRLVENCGGKIHLKGLDNLRKLAGRPVILLGNHMSLLETALFHSIVRPYLDFTFVIKRALFKVPFFGDIMLALQAIPVTRQDPRQDLKMLLREGKYLVKNGKSIIMFPQGTRSENFSPEDFGSIGIKLARAAKVDVIPFALKTDFLKNGKFLRDLGPVCPENHVHFEFGEPIKVEGNGKDANQQVIDFVISRLKEWHNN
ncbi:MAG: lysophospholipid acyltransferase family protein [Victivallaceae bacterium]|nr:lysophospholipid acyltransferase family protein [Victivallaceae bacterium]